MKIRAIVSTVKENRTQSKAGLPVVYRDVHLVDLSPEPLTRFTGEVVVRPTDDEFREFPLKRGDKLEVAILQVLEMRSGNPVCRVHMERFEDKPAAK